MTARRRAAEAGAETVLTEFVVASEPGNERLALARVADAVSDQGLSEAQLERLKTAVAEATMNAIEHGNHNRPDIDVDISVRVSADGVAVSITDHGGDKAPAEPVATPDLDEKLAGLQSPRGWGLFLIQNMVDAVDTTSSNGKHTVRLVMRPEHPGAGTNERARGKEDEQQL